jgi:site-specific DNA-cytosine methylase
MTELTVGSMFAGIGGFDLAAQRAGMDPLWAVEKDPAARKLVGLEDCAALRRPP